MFGYEDKQGYVNPNALKDGEIVDVMILGWRFQPAYLKAIADENKIAKEHAEGLGDDFKAKQPTVKEGGMTFDYAIIKRDRKGGTPKEYIFGTDITALTEPTYVCYGQFDADVPNQIQRKGFNYQQRVGGQGIDRNGNPFIVNDFPRADDKYFVNGAFTSFAEIPEFADGYDELNEKEKKRQSDWDIVTKVFEGLSEEQVIEGLKENTAKRFLMCHIPAGQKKVIYILPEKGVIFRCKVAINKNGYTTLIAFETKKVGDKYETIYYSNFNTYPVTPENVEYANAIIKLKADNKKAREEAKKNKAEQKEEKMVEQEEFEPFWDDDGKPAF